MVPALALEIPLIIQNAAVVIVCNLVCVRDIVILIMKIDRCNKSKYCSL